MKYYQTEQNGEELIDDLIKKINEKYFTHIRHGFPVVVY